MTAIQVDNGALHRYVLRIEAFLVERKEVNENLAEVYAEAKEAGFNTVLLRQIVRERALEAQVRHDQYAILNSYRAALGMLADTPLGEAAIKTAEAVAAAIRPKPNGTAEAAEAAAGPARRADATAQALQAGNGTAPQTVSKPRKPFAQQPVHPRRRGRPPKQPKLFDRAHPDGDGGDGEPPPAA